MPSSLLIEGLRLAQTLGKVSRSEPTAGNNFPNVLQARTPAQGPRTSRLLHTSAPSRNVQGFSKGFGLIGRQLAKYILKIEKMIMIMKSLG